MPVRKLILGATLFAAGFAAAEPLYKSSVGPFAVRVVEELTLPDPVQQRDVTLRLLLPETDAGEFPIIVYSTGMFCYPQMYDRITSHWVSHGYVVIQPNHLDSPNNERKLQPEQYSIVMQSRMRDVSFVLDAIDEIAAEADISPLIDPRRAAIGGHSFGSVISMIKTGLHLKPEHRGSWGATYDDRFQAAVLMSGVGLGMEQMADNAFDGLRKPFIASGGTSDIGRVNPGGMSGTEWRMQPFLLAPPGDKYSLITEGTDHYMGGLICNAELGGDPDPQAVKNVRAMTTAFLDAYLKQDAAAMNYLRTADVAALTRGAARFRFR